MMLLIYDVRLALRALRRRPGMVAAVVATLALSIGANTAVFSLLRAVILHPLAVANPDRLVAIYTTARETPYGSSTFAMYQALAPRRSTLDGVAAYWTLPLPELDGDRPHYLATSLVTDDYFTLLGVRPAIGRTILPIDPDDPGANPVAVLSNACWRTRFGGDPTIVGKQIHLHGQPLTVIGVAPSTFHGTDLANIPDVWVPVSMVPLLGIDMVSQPNGMNPDVPVFSLFARLRAGVSVGEATADIARTVSRANVQSPFAEPVGAASSPVAVLPIAAAAAAVRDRSNLFRVVRLLVGVVILILLLACMNVANLLFVRARERSRELGVRTALGASTRRLAQQLFTEGLVLAVLGAGTGVAVAFGMLRVLSAFTLPGRIALDKVSLGIDAPVLAFTCVMSLLTAVGFGLLPALGAARLATVELLRDRSSGPVTMRHRGALLAVQVAISVTLIVGAGLLLRSMRAGLNTDLGFDPRPLAGVSVAPKQDGTSKGINAEYMAVLDALGHAPGVVAVAAATHVPLAPVGTRPFGIGPVSDTAAPGARKTVIGVSHIAGEYFRVLGVPVLMGRSFTNADGPSAPHVVILNESAARALWPRESPLGKVIHSRWFGPVWLAYTVVGVVRDTKYGSLQDHSVPFAYVPLTQEDLTAPLTFIVRSDHPRAALVALQRTLAAVAPDLQPPPFADLRPRLISEQIDVVLAPQRIGAALLSGFALLALCVCAVGIYGTVAYTTSRRSTEIGIRMALGARSAHVLRVVLFEAGIAVGIGIGLGLLGAAVTTQFLARYLYEVPRSDPVSFGLAIGVAVAMAAAAAIIPSWRALRIDPVKAIRALE